MKKNKVNQTEFPNGWDQARVKQRLTQYEEQNKEEAVAEDEAAFADRTQTVMEIPTALVPLVRELVAKYYRDKRIAA